MSVCRLSHEGSFTDSSVVISFRTSPCNSRYPLGLFPVEAAFSARGAQWKIRHYFADAGAIACISRGWTWRRNTSPFQIIWCCRNWFRQKFYGAVCRVVPIDEYFPWLLQSVCELGTSWPRNCLFILLELHHPSNVLNSISGRYDVPDYRLKIYYFAASVTRHVCL